MAIGRAALATVAFFRTFAQIVAAIRLDAAVDASGFLGGFVIDVASNIAFFLATDKAIPTNSFAETFAHVHKACEREFEV